MGWLYRRPVPCAGRSVAVWGATKRQAPRDGLGFQPAVVRAHRRASALSPMPGNSRRRSARCGYVRAGIAGPARRLKWTRRSRMTDGISLIEGRY